MSNESKELKTQVCRVYREVNRYADAHGGVECGLNVLYGPPIPNPTVLIVSMQGGGADQNRQRCWPPALLYTKDDSRFGSILRHDFRQAGLCEVLEEKTVATNIAFPQAEEFDKWRRKPGSASWLKMSAGWVEELIRLMPPQVLLTYGEPPFQKLIGRKKVTPVEQATWHPSSQAVPSGPIPLVGCPHLSRARKDHRQEAMRRVRAIVNASC